MFRFFDQNEISKIYPHIFKLCFGKEDNIQAPAIVGVIEIENEIAAFISGYWVNKIEFYIQYCGIVPNMRGKLRGMNYLETAMEEIGARFYTTMIPGDNAPAMKVVMDCGFRLIGVRQTTSGQILGEWIIMRNTGDNLISRRNKDD
jgi:hypothetical protein